MDVSPRFDKLSNKRSMRRQETVWAPEMKTFRILALKILGPTILLMIVVIWACLPLYWGSRRLNGHLSIYASFILEYELMGLGL